MTPAQPLLPYDATSGPELRRFLELGAAQLDAAMRESNVSVDQLAAAVSGLATDALALAAHTRSLDAEDAVVASQARRSLRHLSDELAAHVQSAITALQFYDKLIQRLTHVRDGLAIPSDSTAGGAGPQPSDFESMLDQVRSRYSMVEERVLFDFMLRGLNADQMLSALTGLRNAGAPGELEAF